MYALDKNEERLKALIGDPTEKVVSSSGAVFYLNDVAQAIAKVRVYAEICCRVDSKAL